MDQFDKMLAKYQPVALSLFRFFTGLLLFQYGIAKIFKFPVLPYFANIPPLITVAGTIELVLGALLMIPKTPPSGRGFLLSRLRLLPQRRWNND